MAVYQPRRAAIATILVAVMQDDIREELLGRHKRGRTKEWIRRREEKGMYRLVEELRAEDTVAYKEMMRMNYETLSEILMAIEPEISKEQVIVLLFLTGRWQTCGSHIALSPPWLPPLTEKLSCTIIRSVKRKKLSWTIMSNLNMSKLHDSWW